MPRRITSATSLHNLRKEAKRWLAALRGHDSAARARLEQVHPAAPATPTLRDVQHALALEHGHESWVALKRAVEDTGRGEPPAPGPQDYQRVVTDLLLAFNSRDEPALARLNALRGTSFTFDDLGALIWARVYAFRQRSHRSEDPHLLEEEARTLVAQNAGYSSWAALTGTGGKRAARMPAFIVDVRESVVSPKRLLDDREWNDLIETVKERRISTIDAHGHMTDGMMARVCTLDHVIALRLGGSRQLTDDGLQYLARMPQLQHLELNEYPGGRLTDRGLQVLRQLPALRSFEMTWQRGISDVGVRHLAACERLERVDVMGTPTGDGLIEAMQGKAHLRVLKTGRLVTDAGLSLLRQIPQLRERRASSAALPKDEPALLIDGPFTNSGFAHIAALEGVVNLDLFWHVKGITSDAFAHLSRLPRLEVLGADGALSDDAAMAHFAAIPRLRALRAQEAAATDTGFEALGGSRTLEGFWGRDCPNFGSRGFVAFSKMPALRSLGVNCRKVDDGALALLPQFPSLRELTPIGFQDAGFRHVGACRRLERLTCMYCRETTDAATAHVAGLPLKYYYAGLTLITDRTLEILGRMTTLEQVEFYECKGITDEGLPFLAALPNLREVALDSLPGVTLAGTRVFAPHVRVRYST